MTHLDGIQRYWYDANGNQSKRVLDGNTDDLRYDAENRLFEVKRNGSVIEIRRLMARGVLGLSRRIRLDEQPRKVEPMSRPLAATTLFLAALVVAVAVLPAGTGRTAAQPLAAPARQPDSPAAPLVPLTVHFHGNTEDMDGLGPCTGNGSADVVGCDGPFLREEPVLSSGAAAQWVVPDAGNDGANPRNIYDPQWLWVPSVDTTVAGDMTIEWWASCGGCAEGVTDAAWTIRLFTNIAVGGTPIFTQVVTDTPSLPNVTELLSATLTLPEINVTGALLLHIDPVYVDVQNNTKIYYDSQLPCPGAVPGSACDSRVTFTVTGGAPTATATTAATTTGTPLPLSPTTTGTVQPTTPTSTATILPVTSPTTTGTVVVTTSTATTTGSPEASPAATGTSTAAPSPAATGTPTAGTSPTTTVTGTSIAVTATSTGTPVTSPTATTSASTWVYLPLIRR